MDIEDYLIEEKAPIMAIARISKLIKKCIENNYYNNDFRVKEEVLGLNMAIMMIAYCMRTRRYSCYKEICSEYEDDFSYNSMIYEDL